MRLSHLVALLALVGGLWYFDLLPFGKEEAPVAKSNPAKIRNLQEMIRQNDRIIEELRDQSWRSRRGTGNDNTALIIRNKKIAELQKENSKLQARIGAGGH